MTDKPDPTTPHADRAKALTGRIQQAASLNDPAVCAWLEQVLTTELGLAFDDGAQKSRAQGERVVFNALLGHAPSVSAIEVPGPPSKSSAGHASCADGECG